MTAWRPARALLVLRGEIDAAAPDRSTESDGMLGDTAHSSRASDHNPNPAGVVRAFDVTHDVRGGCDCRRLSERIAARLGRHPALGSGAYIIFARRIISTDRLDEGWRPYTGPNPHDKHMHVSVATAAAGYDSTARWDVMGQEDWSEMASREEVKEAFREVLVEIFGDARNDKNPDAPDIGKARIVHPNTGKVSSLAHVLYRIDAETQEDS